MRLVGVDLMCERGGRRVFAGLGFAVSGGEALVVTGPNGAGKSSLLRAIAGLVRHGAGTITLEGGDEELGVAAQCHYAGHYDALKPSLTVLENLSFWQSFFEVPGLDPLDALDELEIGHLADLPGAYLSAGQRRRLALARLLVARRPVWLLDEPTSALDKRSEAKLTELMNAHVAAGGIIMAATHTPLDLVNRRDLEIEGARR
ncbi:MAG TPA: heme ABC exporter ATP-binding protein CcmA [Kaistiaceae bacterium]|nr:heme ABC exporter ATP-binding protein CcmA [Kaistiaceae bacterium]